MAFAGMFAGSSESYALVQRTIIADFGSFTDYNRAAVVNKQTAPDFSTRMNLNAGQKTCCLTYEPGCEKTLFFIKKML
jgi:hypothetical protein